MKFLLVLALCAVAASAKPTRADGPADGEYEPIHVGPAIVDGDYQDISVGPAIIDESVVGASSPLVQIIINVKPNSGSPVIKPDPIDYEDIFGPPAVAHDDDEPSPIIVVDEPEPEPQPEPLPEIPVEPQPEPQPEAEPETQPEAKPEPQPELELPVVTPGIILTK